MNELLECIHRELDNLKITEGQVQVKVSGMVEAQEEQEHCMFSITELVVALFSIIQEQNGLISDLVVFVCNCLI